MKFSAPTKIQNNLAARIDQLARQNRVLRIWWVALAVAFGWLLFGMSQSSPRVIKAHELLLSDRSGFGRGLGWHKQFDSASLLLCSDQPNHGTIFLSDSSFSCDQSDGQCNLGFGACPWVEIAQNTPEMKWVRLQVPENAPGLEMHSKQNLEFGLREKYRPDRINDPYCLLLGSKGLSKAEIFLENDHPLAKLYIGKRVPEWHAP